MRITCPQCGIEYSIDDRAVTPRGVRAQCPQCHHLETVKPEREAAAPGPDQTAAPSATRGPQKPARSALPRIAIAAGALLALGVAAVGAWRVRAAKRTQAAVRPAPSALEVAAARWAAELPGQDSSAAELIASGVRKLVQDTSIAVLGAVRDFQRAIARDPSSNRAVAGYVRALAFRGGAHLDETTFQEARALVSAALARSEDAATRLAYSELLLARPTSSGG